MFKMYLYSLIHYCGFLQSGQIDNLNQSKHVNVLFLVNPEMFESGLGLTFSPAGGPDQALISLCISAA